MTLPSREALQGNRHREWLLAAVSVPNPYNQRPTWLDLAHPRLDTAVFAAYGWPPALSDEELLAKLLALNLERTT